MDKMMRVSVTFKLGTPELNLLSEHCPGLRFIELSFWEDLDRDSDKDHVHIDLAGSGADLVRHGFLDAVQLEIVAQCKVVKTFRDDHGGWIEVRRRTSGFRISRKVSLGMIAAILMPHVWSPKAQPIR